LKSGAGIRRTMMKLKEIKGLKYIRDSFKTRHFKYGGYAALITLAVIVGLIVINLIIGQFTIQIDMTESGLFSLSEQTTQVLDQINEPVNLIGLWRPGEENPQLVQVIDLYRSKSRNIRFEAKDLNRNPSLTQQYDTNNTGLQPGSLIVEGPKGFKVIAPGDMYDYMYNQRGGRQVTGLAMERQITAALVYAATGTTPVIYEIMGHYQEYTLADIGMQDLIEKENFFVRQINLFQSDIPEDAAGLILSTPRLDLSRAEADKILDYLESGGRLFVTVDYRIGELTLLNEVLASYGMQVEFGRLIENDRNYTAGFPYIEYLEFFPEHEITKPLMDQRMPVLLANSMGITETPAKRRSVELKPLLTSSGNSFIRTDIFDTSVTMSATDIPGPIDIGMTATDPYWIDPNNPVPQARIVVIACGTVLEMAGYSPGNIDLYMNSITWLVDRPETLTVRSKSMFLLPMRINENLMIIYGIIIVILIPLGFFISGFVIWLRRRHL